MIHVLGDVTTAVKVIYGARAYSDSKITDVTARLAIDPETSHMEALVFAINTLRGISGKQLVSAILTKHPRIAIIVFYQKTEELKEIEEIQGGQNIYVYQLSKSNDRDTIKRSIEDAISKAVLAGNIDLPQSTAPVISPVGESLDIFAGSPSNEETKEPEEDPTVATLKPIPNASPFAPRKKSGDDGPKRIKHFEFTPGGIVNPETARITTVNDWPMPTDIDVSSQRGFDIPAGIDLSSYSRPDQSLVDRMKNAASALDVSSIEAALKNNAVTRSLLNENSEYMSAQQAIALLDQQIRTVFADSKLTPNERMERIQQICADRSRYSAITNKIFVDKFMTVIDEITKAAMDCSAEVCKEYKVKFGNLQLTDALYSNSETLDKLTEERMQGQMELAEIVEKLRKLYLVMDTQKDSAIETLTDYEPSNNCLVNATLKPMQEMFKPVNTSSLVRTIIEGLEGKRITFSEAEKALNDLHSSLFRMYNLNAAINDGQEKMIRLLQAQRVEDIVICDNILKYKIRTVIGPDNVGRTATAVCIASAQARTDNVLLIDLSSDSKLERYIKPDYTLGEFYESQVKDRLMVIKRTPNCIFNDFKFEEALQAAAPHYRYIYVLLSIRDTREYEILKKMSVSVNFVTNATLDKLNETKTITREFNEDNTARYLTLVNCSSNPMEILNLLDIDPLMTKLVMVPFFDEIQSAAIRGSNPCDDSVILNFFTEAYA